MKIVCCEANKYRGGKPACYIASNNATEREVGIFSLRSRLNSELRYYVTRLDEKNTDSEILIMFKNKKYRKEPYFIEL